MTAATKTKAASDASDGTTPDVAVETAEPELFVKHTAYAGTRHVREIDAAAWKNVGAEGQKTTTWGPHNKHTIPASEFSPEALAYFETDDAFSVGPA